MRIVRILSLGAFLCGFAFFAACQTFAKETKIDFTAPTLPVEVYDFCEFEFQTDEAEGKNPFLDTRIVGEFRLSDASSAIKVDGFCDDQEGRRYKLRFMPREQGDYRFRISVVHNQFVKVFEGSLKAVSSKRQGIIKTDKDYPFHFLESNQGKHWFWNGTTTYQILAFDDATIEASLRRLAKLGINRIRVAICGRTKDGTRWNEPLVQKSKNFTFQMEPWIARQPESQEDPQFQVDRFNDAFYDKIDRMMLLARELDIVVSIIFYVDGADKGVDPFGKENAGNEAEQNYYRYTIARLSGYSNLMWDITNEWHLFRTEAWVNQMGDLIQATDPYDHMISVHGSGTFPFRASTWSDFALYQSWDEHGGYRFMLNNRAEQRKINRPMPQINEEYGYEDHYPYPWGDARLWPSRTADTRRRLAWEMTMAGGYQTTGERANTGTGAGLDTGGGWINGRGDDQMTMLVGYKHLKQFFEGFDWWKLEPAPEKILTHSLAIEGSKTPSGRPDGKPQGMPTLKTDPMCLSEKGVRTIVYMPQGGSVTLKLEDGTYHGRWFNPRSGSYAQERSFQIIHVPSGSDAWRSPIAPDAEDWVLQLEHAAK
jgi:hypothetical protein